MKKMSIFDPAMCCATGLCGPSVNPELLRVATVLSHLKQQGIVVERYNLSHNPDVFIQNPVIHQLLNEQGVKLLPVTLCEGQVVCTGRYLSNEEFCQLLEIPETYLAAPVKKATVKKASRGCGCEGGCC